ncbi:MAG: TIM barrel protein [candidate division Zixibacteria bacterium]|nr:TIM barrel protein [candidate division Zixibacteria bacterium]
MKIGVFTVLYDDKPLEEVAAYASGLGYEMVELAAWKGSNHIDIDEVLKGNTKDLKETLNKYNLEISALSNHLEGQLVLGPLDESTDDWAPSKDPEEKVKYGMKRMKDTARAAAELGVPVVVGFTGSPVWGQWYIFPPKNEEMYEKGWELFAERWNEILDTFKEVGVKFALEVHPTEIAYNIETSEKALEVLAHRKEFGFNFDPSHFIWQMIDPVIFIKKFGDRIYHAHAKDSELQEDEVSRSGVIPTGGWMRPNRGFRFRIPGWGQVNWRRVMTALLTVRYDYVLSYEHEDPVMSREDGCEKTIEYLRPLIIKKPLEEVWW